MVLFVISYLYDKIRALKRTKEDPEEFYSRFKIELEKSQSWPGLFLFKFILKTDSTHFETLKSFFKDKEAKWKHKSSSKKKFVSISVHVDMESPEEVIALYLKANKLDGVISL